MCPEEVFKTFVLQLMTLEDLVSRPHGPSLRVQLFYSKADVVLWGFYAHVAPEFTSVYCRGRRSDTCGGGVVSN